MDTITVYATLGPTLFAVVGFAVGHRVGRMHLRAAQDRAKDGFDLLRKAEAKIKRMEAYCLDRADELDASFTAEDHDLRKTLREVAR